MKRLSLEEFITKSRVVHGYKYDYSLVEYGGDRVKVKIICPIHSVFEQRAGNHLMGQGCMLCAIDYRADRKRSCTADFIKKAKKIHGDKYDYSSVNYVNSSTPVNIICKIHGEFVQIPETHLSGGGCNACGRVRNIEKQIHSLDDFIKKAIAVHGDRYDYSEVDYAGAFVKVKIRCTDHSYFFQTPDNHIHGHNCPVCAGLISKYDVEIGDLLKRNGFDVVLSERYILDGNEMDVYIPSLKVGIEHDGLYWHCHKHRRNDYHLKKTMLAEANGIRLIHIFEDEWKYKQEIVESRLLNIVGKSTNKIYARKTDIIDIPVKMERAFLDKNHIQGYVRSNFCYGLIYDGELVSLMSFCKPRLNLGRKSAQDGEFELLRFCNILNTSVVGGASKLLKYFERNVNPSSIYSYADRRWSEGSLYNTLGFEFSSYTSPNYFYVKGFKRENRFKYRKSELVKAGFDGSKTEFQIMEERGYSRIYDCGSIKYVKNFKK